MGLLYSLGIFLYGILIRIASLFSTKAKHFVSGRKNWRSDLSEWAIKNQKPVAWIHCSSLGEYEMARPLFASLFENNFAILISFYSPSGFNNYQADKHVSKVVYLPLDTKSNAKYWVQTVSPELSIFVKYDFWFRIITEVQKQQLKLYLINGLFRTDQVYFKPYGDWFLRKISGFTHLFLINESSANLMNRKGIEGTTVTGDLRYDRVAEICQNAPTNSIIEKFKGNHKLVIGGSTWQPEEKILRAVSDFFPEQKLLIAPHNISPDHIKEIKKLFKGRKCTTYSRAKDKKLEDFQVLIIDNIGLLSSAYQYADIALVGGAFGKGLHNILEAATYGTPLYFGPNIRKFPEASEMVKRGLAHSIAHHDEFIRAVDRIRLEQGIEHAGEIAAFMRAKQGASQVITSGILSLNATSK
jgi:3-deoxy-D-manno-octulosonic-acid transferase